MELSPLEREVRDNITRKLAPFPKDAQQRIVRRLIESEQKRLAEEIAKRDQLKGEIANAQAKLDSIEALRAWFDVGAFALEYNDCSRLHKLKEAGLTGRVLGDEGEQIEKSDALVAVDQTFVVRHDWASAFSGAEGLADDVRLPYEVCAFEFRIRGRTVLAIAGQPEGESPKFTAFAESAEWWYPVGSLKEASENGLIQYLWDQVRAICIALDAEVATSEVIRAPAKLNEKRERQGKPPICDHHVVDLSRRHRIANPSGGHSGIKKRLHFRRGHWRHYEAHKTWVRWCLVGSPDLGFITKDYRL